jgi:hypothetical protein
MKWYSAIVYAIGIAFSVALALYSKTAPAQEVLSGRGIICDTAEQVARVIKADDFQATLVAVNTEKANSCAVLEVAFIIHGEKGETVRIHGDAWQVTQIIVVGANTPQGWGTLDPMVQWSAFQVNEVGA